MIGNSCNFIPQRHLLENGGNGGSVWQVGDLSVQSLILRERWERRDLLKDSSVGSLEGLHCLEIPADASQKFP